MHTMASMKNLTFNIIRKTPELISPAKPTPYEFKYLSDIDAQPSFQLYFTTIYFYKKNMSMEGKDPVKIIRDAVAQALVFYYPLAGRLRECMDSKLVVECNGHGVVFAEADADVMLQQFGDVLYPPFPNLEELFLDMTNHDGMFNFPLMFIQVTRLKCGGFIFACHFNHTMCDAVGLFQFLSAVGELARGAAVPSIPPVWERHLLNARHPLRVSFAHREYEVASDTSGGNPATPEQMVECSFFFSAADISALRHSLPPRLQSCSRFEILAGCMWRFQTIALSPKPDEEIRFLGVMDNRKRMHPPLPVGYYGNVVAFPAAITTAAELSMNPLHYAVELVRKAKHEAATDEYLRSVADLMVLRDRRSCTAVNTYMVSDLTRVGLEQVDLGWGTPAYGGVANGIHRVAVNFLVAWYILFKNGIVVPVCLPLKSMQLFEKQLQVAMTATPTTSSL